MNPRTLRSTQTTTAPGSSHTNRKGHFLTLKTLISTCQYPKPAHLTHESSHRSHSHDKPFPFLTLAKHNHEALPTPLPEAFPEAPPGAAPEPLPTTI